MSEKTQNLNLPVKRKPIEFKADPTRIITRLFIPGDEKRISKTINRVLQLTPSEVSQQLEQVIENFSHRHRDFENVLRYHFSRVRNFVPNPKSLTDDQKLLIGSYFTQEYSIQSAAFFNPSIVVSPDQEKLPPGCTRVILSFRSTGEGHVSSIEFRSGILDTENTLILDEISPYLETSRIYRNMSYDKNNFGMKLLEKRIPNSDSSPDWSTLTQEIEVITFILEHLNDRFNYKQLHQVLIFTRKAKRHEYSPELLNEFLDRVDLMARMNYEIRFSPDMPISERIIFPVSVNESRGIEDARFVRFIEDGKTYYFATYTAFDGEHARTQLLETTDFLDFKIHTINGEQSDSKGLALFPRKIDGKYVMICRSDGENLYILTSDDLKFWHRAKLLQEPKYPWEFVQIGNCGSPVETHAGWLLLTHGVGPMRRYTIGATLLDLEDPFKVIAQSPLPILEPNEQERDGYVPNVVYSCGYMAHNGELIIPYAMSDSSSSVATVPLDELLSLLKAQAH